MEFLYKYRDITNHDIEKCFNIQNLVENKATISSRTKFDDPDDSKFNYIRRNFKYYKFLKTQIPRKRLNEFKKLKNENGFTKEASILFQKLEKMLSGMIDNYGIYCLTGKGTDEFMWNKYANEHKGFCIKFRKEMFGENFGVYPMKYAEQVPKLNLYDTFKIYFDVKFNEINLGKEIYDKLFMKLTKYKLENEYRYIMSGNLDKKGYILKPYPKEAVEEVIFGHNMDIEVKKYIMKHTDFKCSQIVKDSENLKIVPFR